MRGQGAPRSPLLVARPRTEKRTLRKERQLASTPLPPPLATAVPVSRHRPAACSVTWINEFRCKAPAMYSAERRAGLEPALCPPPAPTSARSCWGGTQPSQRADWHGQCASKHGLTKPRETEPRPLPQPWAPFRATRWTRRDDSATAGRPPGRALVSPWLLPLCWPLRWDRCCRCCSERARRSRAEPLRPAGPVTSAPCPLPPSRGLRDICWVPTLWCRRRPPGSCLLSGRGAPCVEGTERAAPTPGCRPAAPLPALWPHRAARPVPRERRVPVPAQRGTRGTRAEAA